MELDGSLILHILTGSDIGKMVGTKKEADQVHRQIEVEIIQGEWDIQETEDISFRSLAQKYLEYSKANKGPNTFRGDKCRIESHLLPYFGDMPIKFITPKMVDDYKQRRLNTGVTPCTVNYDLTNLSHMLRMAIRWKYIDRNIVSSVDKMKVPEKAARFLNQDEIHRLVEAARCSYIYELIITALHTGMRKSELFNLKWSDINFEQLMVTVQSKDDWSTKNYKHRSIQLTPVLYDVLRELQQQQLNGNIQSEYVFTYNGLRLRSNIKRSLRRVVKMAELENVTLHTLRHTFASQLVMAGVSLMQVQELMGHQSYETTLQYAHLSEDHSKREVLKLPFANGHGKAMARIRHAEANSVDIKENEKPCETASSQGL